MKQTDTKQILVRTPRNGTIVIDVMLHDTISSVKAKIERREQLPSCLQSLDFASKQLDDERTLDEYNVQNRITLRLHRAAALPGGGMNDKGKGKGKGKSKGRAEQGRTRLDLDSESSGSGSEKKPTPTLFVGGLPRTWDGA